MSLIRPYTSFLNLERNTFYLILFLSILLFSTDAGAKIKDFLSLKPRKAQTFRPNSRS